MCGARRSNDSGVNFRARNSTHGCAARSSKAARMARTSCGCGRHSPKICWRRATGIVSKSPSPRSRAPRACCVSPSSRATLTMEVWAMTMRRRTRGGLSHVVDTRLPIQVAMIGPRSLTRQMNYRLCLRRIPRRRALPDPRHRARRFHLRPAPAAASVSAPRSTVAALVAKVAEAPMAHVFAMTTKRSRPPRRRVGRTTIGPTEPPR